jgi:hypothetical protein
MPGLVPGIHGFGAEKEDVDGRVKPGHDDFCFSTWKPATVPVRLAGVIRKVLINLPAKSVRGRL